MGACVESHPAPPIQRRSGEFGEPTRGKSKVRERVAMSDQGGPLRKKVTIRNRAGLHARAASLVRETVLKHRCRVTLIKAEDCSESLNGAPRADGTSVIEMLSLGAMEGESLILEAEGEEARQVLEELERLIECKFWEDDFALESEKTFPGPK